MKFRVLGYSKENGAKVTMEFEASSKAEAERKAIKSHLEVIRVEPAAEAEAREANQPRAAISQEASRGGGGGSGGRILLLLVLVGLAVAAWYFWPQIMAFIGRK